MGKSSAPPPAPDFTALAKEQGKQNLEAAQTGVRLSNPNMITPFGNQTVTYSQPTFDEARYNADLARFNAQKPIDRSQYMRTGSDDYTGNYSYFDQAGYDQARKELGAAPDKTAYMTGGGTPTVTQTLTPTAQATLDAQQRVQQRLAALGETAMGNVQNTLSTPFVPTTTEIQHNFADYGRAQNTFADRGIAQGTIDSSNIAKMPIDAGTNAQKLILDRLNPTIQAGDVSFRQQLANQGLTPGTAAYDAAFRNREMSKNDLINQAALQGINLDMQANQQGYNQAYQNAGLYNAALGQNYSQDQGRAGFYNNAIQQDYSQALNRAQFQNTAQQQQLAQDLALRSQPINELAAIMGGSQIQLPQFAGYQGTSVAPAPVFAAGQQQYQTALGAANAQNAANSQFMQGLFGLGAAGLMAPKGTFSDRRLKKNIKQIGVADNGLNVYSYNYIWGGPTQLGYMADEVEKVAPQAIGERQGFKTVDYGMI